MIHAKHRFKTRTAGSEPDHRKGQIQLCPMPEAGPDPEPEMRKDVDLDQSRPRTSARSNIAIAASPGKTRSMQTAAIPGIRRRTEKAATPERRTGAGQGLRNDILGVHHASEDPRRENDMKPA
jgi:hypothetical protein